MTRISLIEGDGIGFEVTRALRRVLRVTDADIRWELFEAGKRHFDRHGVYIGEDFYESIEKTKIAIKGPMALPEDYGFKSAIHHLRDEYDLYVREARIMGVSHNNKEVDLSIFFETSNEHEDEDFEKEFASKDFSVTSRGTKKAFMLARKLANTKNLDTITVIRSENASNYFDDFFLDIIHNENLEGANLNLKVITMKEFLQDFPNNPSDYNIVVCQSEYGEIIENLTVGLIKEALMWANANYGDEYAIFEPSHGPEELDNPNTLANAISTIFAGSILLEYLNNQKTSQRIENTLEEVLVQAHKDGRKLTTDELTEELTSRLS